MVQARGGASQVLLDFETTYGADPTTPNGRSMPFNFPFDFKATQALKETGTHRGVRDAAMPFYGNHDVKGSIVVPVDQVSFGYWLKALLGAPSTSGIGDPYTHVFKPGTTIPSMVLESGFTDITKYLKFNGVKVNKMSLDFAPDVELVGKVDLMGAKETPSATAYDATPEALTFTRFQAKELALKEGGSIIAYVQAVTLDISNELDGDSFVIAGGGIRGGLSEGDCLVSGRIKVLFQDLTLYNKAVNGTESSLEITLTTGTHSLVLLVPELLYERQSPSIVKGGVYVEMPFRAYYENNADSAVLKATLVNNYATYV